MEIRLLAVGDMPQAKALWKEAFGDPDAFIEWYFSNKILPGNSIGIFDSSLVSVLHMIPYRVMLQGRAFESVFIAGAATAESRRGEGLMRMLLLESLRLMKRRGILMTYLYPFRHSFYEKFGWATYTRTIKKTAMKAEKQQKTEIVETTDWKPLEPLYNDMMQKYDGYVIRGEREWRWRIEELAADKGRAAMLLKDGVPAAYMLFFAGKENTEVIETVYTCEEDIEALLAYLLEKGDKVEYYMPANGKKALPHAMARVVDAKELLAFFGVEDVLKGIKVTDDLAAWNNLGNGNIISIGELALAAHCGLIADDYNNNMCYNILRKVFLYRDTCIFEAY